MSQRAKSKTPNALAVAQRKARELRDGTFVAVLRRYGIPEPEREVEFARNLKPRPRAWRFDFAWPKHFLALEVDGGAYTGGRHTRGQGFVNDQEKTNAAIMLGWRVLRITPAQMDDLGTVKLIATTLGFINL